MMIQSWTFSVEPSEYLIVPVPERSTVIVATVAPDDVFVTVPVKPGPCADVSVAVRPSALSTSVKLTLDITDENPNPIVALPESVTTFVPPLMFHAGAVPAESVSEPIAPV